MTTRCTALILTLLLASCHLMGPTPSPMMEAKLDQIFAMWSTSTYDNGPRIPWEVGQWVLVRSESSEDRSAVRHQIVKEEAGGFWLETVHTNAFGESYTAMLVMDYDPEHPELMRITKVKLQDDQGKITEIDDASGNPVLALMNVTVSALRQDQAEGAGLTEEVVVPAGTFRDAKRTPYSTQLGGLGTGSGFTWVTHAVPIIGYAKQTSEATVLFQNHLTVEVVVEFGFEDVASHFFP